MSKKLNAIKDAVFYAHEKPEVLANMIAGLISDTATSVSIEGAGSIEIPSSGSVTEDYTAALLSQFGDEMSGTVTLALSESVDGVSVSGNTVTVASTVTAESFTLKATSGTLTATKTVLLTSGE